MEFSGHTDKLSLPVVFCLLSCASVSVLVTFLLVFFSTVVRESLGLKWWFGRSGEAKIVVLWKDWTRRLVFPRYFSCS